MPTALSNVAMSSAVSVLEVNTTSAVRIAAWASARSDGITSRMPSGSSIERSTS
jgi:hypothetical protein